jgi:hypothetical protein
MLLKTLLVVCVAPPKDAQNTNKSDNSKSQGGWKERDNIAQCGTCQTGHFGEGIRPGDRRINEESDGKANDCTETAFHDAYDTIPSLDALLSPNCRSKVLTTRRGESKLASTHFAFY